MAVWWMRLLLPAYLPCLCGLAGLVGHAARSSGSARVLAVKDGRPLLKSVRHMGGCRLARACLALAQPSVHAAGLAAHAAEQAAYHMLLGRSVTSNMEALEQCLKRTRCRSSSWR